MLLGQFHEIIRNGEPKLLHKAHSKTDTVPWAALNVVYLFLKYLQFTLKQTNNLRRFLYINICFVRTWNGCANKRIIITDFTNLISM